MAETTGPPRQVEGGQPHAVDVRADRHRSRSQRRKRRRVALLVAFLVAWLGLGSLALLLRTQHIERDLTVRSTRALQAAGVASATVTFSGRDATLSGPAVEAAAWSRAREAVAGVRGVRTVAAPAPPAQPRPAGPAPDPGNSLPPPGGTAEQSPLPVGSSQPPSADAVPTAASAPPSAAPSAREVQARVTTLVTASPLTFETGSAVLGGEVTGTLDALAPVLTGADLPVAVTGHTDSAGLADLNLALSQARADSVASYLTGRGVPGGQLRTAGVGADGPVADDATSEGRAANRRVDITVQDR